MRLPGVIRSVVFAVAFAITLLASPWVMPALADPTVTVVPPSGPSWRSDCADGTSGCNRTTDLRPVFGIEANGVDPGDRLECWFNYATPGSCGPPLPGCSAQVCASAQPSAPLSSDSRPFVGADLVDSSGTTVIGRLQEVFFDIAPPPTISFGRGFGSLWRPEFSFAIGGDDAVRSQCSLTAFGVSSDWRRCRGNVINNDTTISLPHRRQDYTFRMWAVDDFGRAAYPKRPALNFDPIPCASQVPVVSLETVISQGLPVRSSCSFVPGMYVSLFVFPYRGAGQKPLAVKVVKGLASRRWSTSFRLRPTADAASYMRLFSSLRVVLFSDPDNHCPNAPCTYSGRTLTLGR